MLDLLSTGVQIAVFGMMSVFVLLGCLVFALQGMSRLAALLQPVTAEGLQPDPAELTVAVAAAIHAYRREQR